MSESGMNDENTIVSRPIASDRCRATIPAEPPRGLVGFTGDAFDKEVVTRQLFGHTQLILNKPEAIRHVLVDNADNYIRSPATLRILFPVIGNGLFLADGEDWREQRRTVAPAFAPRAMSILARHVAIVVNQRAAQLAAGIASGTGVVDLAEEMHLLALEVVGRAMFSLDMEPFELRVRMMLRSYSERLGRPTMLDVLLPSGIPTWRDIARWRFRRRWLRLIGELIAARLSQPAESDQPDLLDLMTAGLHRGSTPANRLADQVATMIAAGHATTAVALFWSLYLVAAVPGAQARIAAESDSVDLGPDGAAEALSRLPFTRAVVQEALRLYPPAYLIVRKARRADKASGITIPAGTVVMISPWFLHRHRRLWKEPDVFDPARFLPEASPPDRSAYLPFGLGPRVCIGAQFALTEAILTLAKLVGAFQIELADDRPAVPVAGITLQPERPAPVFRLQVRGSAA
jgi:unspecific monooxygenase